MFNCKELEIFGVFNYFVKIKDIKLVIIGICMVLNIIINGSIEIILLWLVIRI